MAAISQMTVSKAFSWMKLFHFDSNFTEVCSKSPIDNKAALVQEMAWRQTGKKPLPEPMPTQFTAAYMQHQGGDELSHQGISRHSIDSI